MPIAMDSSKSIYNFNYCFTIFITYKILRVVFDIVFNSEVYYLKKVHMLTHTLDCMESPTFHVHNQDIT